MKWTPQTQKLQTPRLRPEKSLFTSSICSLLETSGRARRPPVPLKTITRQSAIAVVRRLFKMGLKSSLRRLKTVRRLFHPLPVEMCAMLISDDAYFSFSHFTSFFLNRAERGECFCVDPVWTLKKCAMLKNCTTLIQFQHPPRNVRCLKTLRR